MYTSEKCRLKPPAQSQLVDAAKYGKGLVRLVSCIRMITLLAGHEEATHLSILNSRQWAGTEIEV